MTLSELLEAASFIKYGEFYIEPDKGEIGAVIIEGNIFLRIDTVYEGKEIRPILVILMEELND